jgi:hypothetical protein
MRHGRERRKRPRRLLVVDELGQYLGHVSHAAGRAGGWGETELGSPPSYFIPTDAQCSVAADVAAEPHLAFTNDQAQSLRYFRKLDGAWSSETIARENWGSIAIDPQGVVHISFYDVESHALRFAGRTAGGWVVSTVDDAGFRTGWDGAHRVP